MKTKTCPMCSHKIKSLQSTVCPKCFFDVDPVYVVDNRPPEQILDRYSVVIEQTPKPEPYDKKIQVMTVNDLRVRIHTLKRSFESATDPKKRARILDDLHDIEKRLKYELMQNKKKKTVGAVKYGPR